eukprot:759969-Hanusia_phi.AAC.2
MELRTRRWWTAVFPCVVSFGEQGDEEGEGSQLSLDEKVRSVARGLQERKVHFLDEHADTEEEEEEEEAPGVRMQLLTFTDEFLLSVATRDRKFEHIIGVGASGANAGEMREWDDMEDEERIQLCLSDLEELSQSRRVEQFSRTFQYAAAIRRIYGSVVKEEETWGPWGPEWLGVVDEHSCSAVGNEWKEMEADERMRVRAWSLLTAGAEIAPAVLHHGAQEQDVCGMGHQRA